MCTTPLNNVIDIPPVGMVVLPSIDGPGTAVVDGAV
jgi:hypothetical protein